MPPVMDRQSSQARCREGWALRRKGRTWQEIADALDWKSKASACAAVNKWLAKNPPDDLETMRRATGDTLIEVTALVHESLLEAKKAGRLRDVAELSRVVIDGLDRHAKLTGQHVVVAQEVNVNVATSMEILSAARAQLLDAIDAEVVELPAGEQR